MRQAMSCGSILRLATLLGVGLSHGACGGAMAGEDSGSGGHAGPVNSSSHNTGSGYNLGSKSGGGSGTATSTSSTAKPISKICFGEEKPAPREAVVTWEFDPVTSEECIAVVPMPDTLRLNPAFAYIYFKSSEGARSQVPYLGVGVGACANATAYGGWYATNISGGSTHIGLCSCSCNTARLHGFYLDIATSGIPK